MLRAGALSYYKTENDLWPISTLALYGAAVILAHPSKTGGRTNCLEVSTPSRTLWAYADSLGSAIEWARAIEREAIRASLVNAPRLPVPAMAATAPGAVQGSAQGSFETITSLTDANGRAVANGAAPAKTVRFEGAGEEGVSGAAKGAAKSAVPAPMGGPLAPSAAGAGAVGASPAPSIASSAGPSAAQLDSKYAAAPMAQPNFANAGVGMAAAGAVAGAGVGVGVGGAAAGGGAAVGAAGASVAAGAVLNGHAEGHAEGGLRGSALMIPSKTSLWYDTRSLFVVVRACVRFC